MSEKKELLREYINSQISNSDNEDYRNTARQICDSLSEAQLSTIIQKSNVNFGTQNAETRQQIVHLLIEALHSPGAGLVKSINNTGVGTYVYNLLAHKMLTQQNISALLRDNDKYFDEICYQLFGLNQWMSHAASYSSAEKQTLLADAILDPSLEEKLVTFPDRYNATKEQNNQINFKPYNILLTQAYLHTDQIDKATVMYKQSWSSGDNWFLHTLVDKGHLDRATQYILSEEGFRKNFNGSKNWQFESLLNFFNKLLDTNQIKAIEFITNPSITAIWYSNDMGKFMKSLADRNISEDLVLQFFEAESVTNIKRNAEPVAGEFEKLGKHYGSELIKKIVTANGNKRAIILLGHSIDQNTPADEIYARIKSVYSRYLSIMFD